MFNGSLIADTRQFWKLAIGVVGMLAGMTLLATGMQREAPIGLLGGLVVSASSLAWIMFSLRCPSCRLALMWHAARRGKFRPPVNQRSWVESMSEVWIHGLTSIAEDQCLTIVTNFMVMGFEFVAPAFNPCQR